MKYLVFSDLHFFRGRQYLIDTCNWIADLISNNEPNKVVFCGDLNHSHNFVETDTLYDMASALQPILQRVTWGDGYLHAINGNHDISLRSGGRSILESLAHLCDKLQVYSEPATDGKVIYAPFPPQDPKGMESYMAKLASLNQEQEVMFGHLELSDVRYTPASSHTSDHPFVIPDHIKIVVNGHYHHPERRQIGGKDVIIIGSPCYHSYADMLVDDPRGALLLETAKGQPAKVTRFNNPHGPIYHTIEPIQILSAIQHSDVGRMLIRVRVSGKEEYENCKAAIMRLREVAKAVRVIGSDAKVASEIYKAETSTIDSVSPEAMFAAYVAKKSVDRDLAEFGLKILQGVAK